MFQLFVRIGLQHIGGTLDGFVHIRVVKGIALYFITQVHRGVHLLFRLHEVLIAAFAFALGESQRNGDLAGRLQTLPPEGVLLDFNACKRDRIDGITGIGNRLGAGGNENCQAGQNGNEMLGHSFLCYVSGQNYSIRAVKQRNKIQLFCKIVQRQMKEK